MEPMPLFKGLQGENYQYFGVTFLLYVMHRNQIQSPKSKFLKLFFTCFQNFQKFNFFLFWWAKIDMTYPVNSTTRLFQFITTEAAVTGASMPPMARDLEKSFLDLWRSNCELGQKLAEVLS